MAAHGELGVRTYNGGLGQSTSGVQGQSPWSGQEVRGQKTIWTAVSYTHLTLPTILRV